MLYFGKLSEQTWPLGDIFAVERTPQAVSSILDLQLQNTDAAAWLFWDPELGRPEPSVILALLDKPGDIFHAGLQLGMGGLPDVINFIKPTWMHNCDPSPTIEATSWRMSLRCCMIRTEVMCQLGGILPKFQTLAGGALEMGYRYIRQGVVIRNTPLLLDSQINSGEQEIIPFTDQALFLRLHFTRFWNWYALWRSCRNQLVSFPHMLKQMKKTNLHTSASMPVFSPVNSQSDCVYSGAKVSVLIPTLGRYDFLRKLLPQLRDQTIKPVEIIIIDQTQESLRKDLKTEFPDLPLVIIYQNKRGQSTARNAGLHVAKGEYILFIDDDDEVPLDLIQKHVQAICVEKCEVSCGVAYEDGAGPLPFEFLSRRVSDVFPTNNSMILRSSLDRSGLFDLAFDHGPRADADLGTRLYLSGALMILNPQINLIHHHAPAGGLRTYKARSVTYASSRKSLYIRRIPAATEFYIERRYFTLKQIHESFLIRVISTFGYHGSRLKVIVKLIVSLLQLPDTLLKLRSAKKKSLLLKTEYPFLEN